MEERTRKHVAGAHVPVLPGPVVDLLAPRGEGAGEVYVDCTAGLGGHGALIGPLLGPGGTIALNDADAGNVERAVALVREAVGEGGPRVVGLHGNFADVGRRVAGEGLAADMVLADLGFASSQMDDPERGLSFMREGPLDMRFDRSSGTTAAELVNTMEEGELADILWRFGEERGSRRIASKIVAERAVSPIETTARLASIVQSVLGPRGGGPRIHPATRTFQALRIAVNDELGALEALLESVRRAAFVLRASSGEGSASPSDRSGSWLRRGSRVGVIAFHSLEDRIVKRTFAEIVEQGLAEAVTRRPVEADEREMSANPRARSARLRVIRIGTFG